MWGGFLYSKSHVNRDGLCFSTHDGKVIDIVSLFASGMYADTEKSYSGILYGEENIEILSNSYRKEEPNFKFYFLQYYRKYSTTDFTGDENLTENSMYPKHSFAARFDHENEGT